MTRTYIVAGFLVLLGFFLIFHGGTKVSLFNYAEASGEAAGKQHGNSPADGANGSHGSDATDDPDRSDWDWRELGEATFVKQCSACHGMAGEGMPGVFPALAGNEFVTGDPKTVVRVPMNGRGGMPRFRDALSDEEFAAVLSHIRNAWGNEAEPITPEVVAEVRAE